MIVFPVLIPVQNFLFPGTGRENLKCHGKGRDGKFEACIPGNHGKREFPLTPEKSGPNRPLDISLYKTYFMLSHHHTLLEHNHHHNRYHLRISVWVWKSYHKYYADHMCSPIMIMMIITQCSHVCPPNQKQAPTWQTVLLLQFKENTPEAWEQIENQTIQAE